MAAAETSTRIELPPPAKRVSPIFPIVMLESLTSILRAGADIIITYYARQAACAIS